ncbi:MAG TPA: hypothetical protein VL096_11295 [Pirellulaceae bacterium]|nr:hypothetical protein [Pirellulaceae bacterium]
MSSYVVRGLALLTLVIGFEAVAPLDTQAGPIHKHIEQKMLAKPAKKQKPPPPPKKQHFHLHHHQ